MSENEDILVRGLAEAGTVRVAAVHTTEVARALRAAHDPSPAGAAALGRVATAALLLSTEIKGRQQVGVQVNGDGPLGELYAVADASGRVRATVHHPRAEPGPDDGRTPVQRAVGRGRLTVVRKLSEAAPYRGVVPLDHGGIGEDLARYFVHSEQVPTVIALGERLDPDGVVAAGGFLVQALPGADPSVLAAIEARVQGLPPLSTLLAEGLDPESILGRLFEDLETLGERAVRFHCPCDRPHFARVLISLGAEELEQMRAEQEVTELTCHFCRSQYRFDRDEVGALLLGARHMEARGD